jgi:hypothetical protein
MSKDRTSDSLYRASSDRDNEKRPTASKPTLSPLPPLLRHPTLRAIEMENELKDAQRQQRECRHAEYNHQDLVKTELSALGVFLEPPCKDVNYPKVLDAL